MKKNRIGGLGIAHIIKHDSEPLYRCLERMQKISNERTRRKYSYDFVYREFYTLMARGFTTKQSLDFVKMIIRGQITTYDILMIAEPSIDSFHINIGELEDDKMFFDKSINFLDENVKLKKRHKSDRNFFRGKN